MRIKVEISQLKFKQLREKLKITSNHSVAEVVRYNIEK